MTRRTARILNATMNALALAWKGFTRLLLYALLVGFGMSIVLFVAWCWGTGGPRSGAVGLLLAANFLIIVFVHADGEFWLRDERRRLKTWRERVRTLAAAPGMHEDRDGALSVAEEKNR